MPFPKTKQELEAAGYIYQCARPCKGKVCQATIQIWETHNKKLMPLDIDTDGNVVSHHATCPDVASFRKPDPEKALGAAAGDLPVGEKFRP